MTNTATDHREDPQSETISYLPCATLFDHTLRMGFYSEVHLEKLTDAIRMHGLLQPLIVYPRKTQPFQILSGHYRVRAARRLRMSEVACSVFRGSEEEALRVYCTANLLTRGLNPIEEAHIIAELIRTRGMNMTEIGTFLGHSKSWVSRRLKMLRTLDPKVRRFVESGEIPPRFAQELTRLPQGNEQQRVWTVIQNQHLTKDSASSLVDWWLSATDTERAKMEVTPPGQPCILPHLTEYVVRALKSCCVTINQLASIVSQHGKPRREWPQEEWSQLCKAMNNLAQIIAPHEKGGLDASQ